MLEQAIECGVTHIVCTPHIHVGYFNNAKSTILPAFDALQNKVSSLKLPITLSFAAEVRANEYLPTLIRKNEIPFLGKHAEYSLLLLEMPHSHVPVGIEQLIQWLLNQGIKPLIAHPERNRELQRKPEWIKRLHGLGVLFQLTAGSFIGRFGDKPLALANFIVSQGYADVVASDTHDTVRRPNDMKAAFLYVEEHYSTSLANTLFVKTPSMLLQNYHIKAC